MKIEKKLTATIHFEQWELEILQRMLDRARRYAAIKTERGGHFDDHYNDRADFAIDFEKVAQKILDI